MKISVPVDGHLVAYLRHIRERDGVPISVTVRRAIEAYLHARGELESPRAPHLDVHA